MNIPLDKNLLNDKIPTPNTVCANCGHDRKAHSTRGKLCLDYMGRLNPDCNCKGFKTTHKNPYTKVKEILAESIKETTKEHGSPSVYIDMVGEIFSEKLDELIKGTHNVACTKEEGE